MDRNVGTQEDNLSREWKNRFKRKSVGQRQIRGLKLKRDEDRNESREAGESILSRKAAIVSYVPVP